MKKMKTLNNILVKILSGATAVAAMCMTTSCLNEYLDKAPDAGLTEEEVFSKYDNFQDFFYSVYYGANFTIKALYPFWFDGNNQKLTLYALTDMCDMSRIQRAQPAKQGDGSQLTWAVGYNNDASSHAAKVTYSWKCIRVANKAIENIDMLQDATEREKEDLLAQAYFVRAFCHFELFRFYGSLPYIDKVLGADDEWDLPRPSDHDMLMRIAEDFQTAADHFRNAGIMRRDPSGNLSSADQDKPAGVTALAMKGRALLYDASPLSNRQNETARWEAAAEACWTALQEALDNGYTLLPQSNWTDNFYGTKYTNEQLWAYTKGSTTNYDDPKVQAYVAYCFSGSAGSAAFHSAQCPTQNFVDKFETQKGGYALNTEDQRAVAAAAGEYNEQDPYSNRDPRLAMTVIYNQLPVQGYGNASLYLEEDGSYPAGSLLQKKEGSSDGVSETFYYEHKRTGTLSSKGNQNVLLTDPIIRLAELYLNYAEAANEAYGPNGSAPGASLTAVQAVNVVRARVSMPDVRSEYIADTETFRDRIKNERTVELAFEGHHYYCDIRRWMDAPDIGRSRLYGMRATRMAAGPSAQYPTGFRYERFALPSNRQIGWKNDGMYYIQFQNSDLLKMKNYTPNQSW